MTARTMTGLVAISLLMPLAAAHAGNAPPAAQPTVAEQMAGLQKMCADTAEARTARHNENALYNRLGGYDHILEFTTEVVRLHNQNAQIKHLFTNVDGKLLAKHVADFMALGTGGQATYAGRDLPTSHRSLHLTDADFLSAGGDIVTAAQTVGYGQNEIDEIVCILVSLKDQVVFEN